MLIALAIVAYLLIGMGCARLAHKLSQESNRYGIGLDEFEAGAVILFWPFLVGLAAIVLFPAYLGSLALRGLKRKD